MDLKHLRDIELFANFDDLHFAHLASILREEEAPPGTVLFQEGERGEKLFIIVEGRVRISKIVEGFGEEALAILDEGSFFGEMSLIEPDDKYSCHAIAHSHCILYTFPFDELRELLRTDKDLAASFLWSMVRVLAQRLRATNSKVEAMFAMAKFGSQGQNEIPFDFGDDETSSSGIHEGAIDPAAFGED